MYAVAKERKRLRRNAAWLALDAMQTAGLHDFKPATYRVIWYYKGTQPDADNALARCKSIIDGACDTFRANDKHLELAGVQRVHALHRPECGSVTVIFDDGKEAA